MLLDEVDDVEACSCAVLVFVGKEEPFVVASCVGVILQDEVVLLEFALETLVGVEEVAAFEVGVEEGLGWFLGVGWLVVCGIVICGVIQRKDITCVLPFLPLKSTGGYNLE
jgi:hypothetical protein